MPTETIYQGGCLCGAVRYRASAEPLRGVICHCQACRRHSGAPALAFVHFPIESFQWTGAQPSWFRSSQFAQRAFCATCGSTLGMREEVLAERVQVSVGSLDEPERVRIDDHVWTQSRVPWFDTRDALPRFATSSNAVPSLAEQPPES
ncbi:GFA family protein [Lysobacter sp. GCM10012299]|uniref:GFA family protein n=1 Tax=Lysobacter sp. GCM10012299 TaxID=3317333 RepID=UPI003610A4DD